MLESRIFRGGKPVQFLKWREETIIVRHERMLDCFNRSSHNLYNAKKYGDEPHRMTLTGGH